MTGDLNATFEHRPIYTLRRFLFVMRRTTISHFSFLISHFSFKRSFQTESKGSTPHGLTLNPQTINLKLRISIQPTHLQEDL